MRSKNDFIVGKEEVILKLEGETHSLLWKSKLQEAMRHA